jgi:hypothetical protein
VPARLTFAPASGSHKRRATYGLGHFLLGGDLRELGLRMIRWRVKWYWYVVAIGMSLADAMLTAGLNVALEASTPMLAFGSVSTIFIVFAVRLVNPGEWARSWAGEASPSWDGGEPAFRL